MMQQHFHSLALLLRLRYRLLWAQARLRNGKVVLYLIGSLILLLALVFMQMGGIGGATALVLSDSAETIIGIILSACCLNAILIAIFLGFGMNSVFSDSVLRRYPILRVERFAARQIVSLLEPLWLLMLVLYLGFAVGFSLFGTASLLMAVPAALLLAAVNYFPARILSILIERIMATRHGPQILLVVVMSIFMLPSLLVQIDWKTSGILEASHPLLRLLPPFAAAAVFAGNASFYGLGWTLLLFIWCIALFAAVYWLDRLPVPIRSTGDNQTDSGQTTESFYDRVTEFFNPQIAPLIGKILRYYIRSPQLRFNYLAALIMIVPFTLVMGGRTDGLQSFAIALSYICIAGYLSMGAMTSNVFGFDGSGFRRYFLLPVPAKSVVRAAAIVPLLLGVPIILISTALWLAITPAAVNGIMLLWLFSAGFAGLLLFQTLGLWLSLLSPRAIPFKTTFGNKLSLGANILMILSICIVIYFPIVLDYIGMEIILANWWIGLVLIPITFAFYVLTLHTGARYFSSHREKMLSTIERGC